MVSRKHRQDNSSVKWQIYVNEWKKWKTFTQKGKNQHEKSCNPVVFLPSFWDEHTENAVIESLNRTRVSAASVIECHTDAKRRLTDRPAVFHGHICVIKICHTICRTISQSQSQLESAHLSLRRVPRLTFCPNNPAPGSPLGPTGPTGPRSPCENVNESNHTVVGGRWCELKGTNMFVFHLFSLKTRTRSPEGTRNPRRPLIALRKHCNSTLVSQETQSAKTFHRNILNVGGYRCGKKYLQMIFLDKIIIIISSIVFILHFSWYSAALHKMHIRTQNTGKTRSINTE